MPIYDLHCTRCDATWRDVSCRPGEWGTCTCGAPRAMTPFVFATDVLGCERVSGVLDEGVGDRPLRYTSTREREAKMRRMGFEPAGDRVHGARNQDGYRGMIFSDGGRQTA